MDAVRTRALIEAFEACRLTAYWDPIGHAWTIGWGYNPQAHGCTAADAKAMVWTQAEADQHLTDGITSAWDAILRQWPWASALSDPRQAVLVSMEYQLGLSGLEGFQRTIAHIKSGNYAAAASGMLASLWDKQTPSRAGMSAQIMHSGLWPVSINGRPVA